MVTTFSLDMPLTIRPLGYGGSPCLIRDDMEKMCCIFFIFQSFFYFPPSKRHVNEQGTKVAFKAYV